MKSNIEQALIDTVGFGTEEFIRKAVEGGWMLKGNAGGEISNYDPVTNTFAMKDGNTWLRPAVEVILLDPSSWEAVGKVECWGAYCLECKAYVLPFGECMCDEEEIEPRPQAAWIYSMHRFIDTLIEQYNSNKE